MKNGVPSWRIRGEFCPRARIPWTSCRQFLPTSKNPSKLICIKLIHAISFRPLSMHVLHSLGNHWRRRWGLSAYPREFRRCMRELRGRGGREGLVSASWNARNNWSEREVERRLCPFDEMKSLYSGFKFNWLNQISQRSDRKDTFLCLKKVIDVFTKWTVDVILMIYIFIYISFLFYCLLSDFNLNFGAQEYFI